jgi:outer membrane protein assembly factor BamB
MFSLPTLALSLSLFAPDPTFQPKPFDWPQWQGPDRTAITAETGLLKDWPKDGPPLAWRIKGLGEGYSTPTVAAGRIFSMGNIEKSEFVTAFAEKDGAPLWKREVHSIQHYDHPGARCSPTVDGEFVYALGVNGDLLCLKAENGDEVWRKDLSKDFKGARGGWGYTESPLIDGDRLLCTPGGKDNTLVALNKKTGDTIWSCKVPEGDSAAYASIIKADVDGKKQYIQFLGRGVVGVSEDGKFLWRYDHPANGTANCSTPIFQDGAVFAASGYGTGGGLARIKHDGDKYTADEVFFTKHMQNHHGGMVVRGGFLYGSDEGRLACINLKNGDVAWSSDKTGKGSIACVEDRLYYRNEGGPVILAEVNSTSYVEHGRFTPPDKSDKEQWAHPVIANGKLYIRDQDALLCYDVTRH